MTPDDHQFLFAVVQHFRTTRGLKPYGTKAMARRAAAYFRSLRAELCVLALQKHSAPKLRHHVEVFASTQYARLRVTSRPQDELDAELVRALTQNPEFVRRLVASCSR